MSAPLGHRLLAAPAALLLAAGLLAACGGSTTTTPGAAGSTADGAATAPESAPDATAPVPSASDGATRAAQWTPSPSPAPGPDPTGSPTTDPALEDAWSTAVRAIADNDSAAFLTVATRAVYDEMTAEQHAAVDTVFNDWDVMGARWTELGSTDPRVAVTAGSCTQGVEPASLDEVEGSPTVTCRLTFTNDADGAPDKTMGLFYLQRNEDGSWTIVDYLRQYL